MLKRVYAGSHIHNTRRRPTRLLRSVSVVASPPVDLGGDGSHDEVLLWILLD
jgi:hypothetical protein